MGVCVVGCRIQGFTVLLDPVNFKLGQLNLIFTLDRSKEKHFSRSIVKLFEEKFDFSNKNTIHGFTKDCFIA